MTKSIQLDKAPEKSLPAVSLVVLLVLFVFYWEPRFLESGDAVYYLQATERPLTFIAPPFSYRIFVPLIGYLLPIPSPTALILLTFTGLTLASGWIFHFCRTKLSIENSTLCAGFFLLSPIVTFSLMDPYLVDPIFVAFLSLAILGLARRSWALVLTGLLVGVLAKETILFLLPSLAFLYMKWRSAHSRVLLVAIVAPILLYLIIHYTPLLFGESTPNYSYLSIDTRRFVLDYQRINFGNWFMALIRAIFESFSFLWVLAAVSAWRLLRTKDADLFSTLSRGLLLVLVPVAASLLVATDWTRMLGIAYVTVLPLAAAELRGLKVMLSSLALYGAQAAITWRTMDTNIKVGLEIAIFCAGLLAYHYFNRNQPSVWELRRSMKAPVRKSRRSP